MDKVGKTSCGSENVPNGITPFMVNVPAGYSPKPTPPHRPRMRLLAIFILLLGGIHWLLGQTPTQASPPNAPQAQTNRLSLSANGTEGNGHSFTPALSADNNWVAFVSGATNLTSQPTDGTWLVHLKNIQTGTVTLVSVSSMGVPANDHAFAPALSANGQQIAFESAATNLVTGTINTWSNVFIHNTATLTTTLISKGLDGTPGNAASEKPALSADGRYVVFQSNANNLIANDFSPHTDIFIQDRDADMDSIFDEPEAILTLRLSQAADGTPANDASIDPAISANGRWVVFASFADNLVAGDTNNHSDIFLYDRDSDGDGVYDELGSVSVTLISMGFGGLPADGFSTNPVISPDGNHIAFESFATNLVAGGTTQSRYHIFVWNRAGAGIILASQSSAGNEANNWSEAPTLSENGRWVAFSSSADNLVVGDTNFSRDIFVRDRDVDGNGVFDEAGQVETVRVSLDYLGGQMVGGQAANSVIAWDGNHIAFESDATTLVPMDLNGKSDIFLHTRHEVTPIADLALIFEQIRNVQGGQMLVMTPELRNFGPELAVDAQVEAQVSGYPLDVVYWNTPSQGSCVGYVCQIGQVGVEDSVQLGLVARIQGNKYQVYQGWVSVQLRATSLNDDPVPSNNMLALTHHFYACEAIDGCALDDIVCFLFGNSPMTDVSEILGEFIPNLALYYQVRDQVLNSPAGQTYINLYYTHSDEVSDLIFADENLWNLALNGLFQWESHITALVEGHGDTAVITAAQIETLEAFLDALSASGSPALQQAIADERAKLPPLASFVGLTMAEAQGLVVGYTIYLPSTQK